MLNQSKHTVRHTDIVKQVYILENGNVYSKTTTDKSCLAVTVLYRHYDKQSCKKHGKFMFRSFVTFDAASVTIVTCHWRYI